MNSNNRYLLLLVLYSLLTVANTDRSCAADGTCDAKNCGMPPTHCQKSSRSKDIYRHGGSAQAFKANQPKKKAICDPEMYGDKTRHKVASWPYFASTRRRSPPRLQVTLKLWSCSLLELPSTKNEESTTCCCHPFEKTEKDLLVQVWQARPDGRYSSLREGQEDGDCRATSTSLKGLSFETVAPGSTGILGGLGPYGWDWAPYGTPVLHILVSSSQHAPTLVNVPVMMERTTLEQKSSSRWADWRGAAWVQDKEKDPAFDITSWKANPKKNVVDVQIDVYLQEAAENIDTDLSGQLCRSWVYGLPSSFFLEPITECAPSMLDFFAL